VLSLRIVRVGRSSGVGGEQGNERPSGVGDQHGRAGRSRGLVPDHAAAQEVSDGIMVLGLTGDQVATITGFPDPALFSLFDLPDTAPDR
jgi:hypothetical protein